MTFDTVEELSAFMREERTKQGFYLYDLEDQTGIAISTIHKIEKNKTENPSFFVLSEVLDVLGYELQYKVVKRIEYKEWLIWR